MALSTFSSSINVTTNVPDVSYNKDIIEIIKKENETVDINNIYVSITSPPNITVNITKDISELPPWKQVLNTYYTSSMGIVLVVLMLGMGSHVSWRELLGHLWPPLPILIGMFGQFVLLPALAFGISILFKLAPYTALGTLILSCSPGGAFSNFFTYWIKGDVALSIVMTTCSTVLSFGTMPLNLWIYSPHLVGEQSDSIVIPYKNIVRTLAFVCVPVIVGIVIRHFSERAANKITQVASIMGYIIVIINVSCLSILFWDSMASADWLVHISVMILAPSGMTFAYTIAFISGRSHKICRTIAMETASQNMSVAIGIIILSFPDMKVRIQMMVYPLLYIMYMFSEIGIVVLSFRFYYNRKEKRKIQSELQLSIKEPNET